VGRISTVVMSLIAVLVACSLGNLQQAFQFIQEYTGMVSPGITAIFILGLYWKKTTSAGALWGTIFSIPISLAIKLLFPEMPFLDQMLVVFFIIVALIVVLSVIGKQDYPSKGLILRKEMFYTGRVFNVMSVLIVLILTAIYFIFW
jgi:SSS family solute:Na+ symporter